MSILDHEKRIPRAAAVAVLVVNHMANPSPKPVGLFPDALLAQQLPGAARGPQLDRRRYRLAKK